MTHVDSFSSADGVNPPASASESTSVNSQNEGNTVPDSSVNLSRASVNLGSALPPARTHSGQSVTLKADPGIDAPEMARFLGMVFGKADRPIEICAFTEGSKHPRPFFWKLNTEGTTDTGESFTVTPQTLAEAVADGDRNGILPSNKSETARQQVNAWYIRMTTLGAVGPSLCGGRGGSRNVGQVFGFWTDGDYGTKGHAKPRENALRRPQDADQVRAIWTAAGYPAPSVDWMTGGGLNGLWMFPEPVTIPAGAEGEVVRQRLADLSDRWNRHLVRTAASMDLKYDNVGNLDRLLRLPGSVNRKSDHAYEPKAVYADYTGATYGLDELEALLPSEPVAVRRTPARDFDGAKDGDSPSGAYNAHMWADSRFRQQLADSGWQHHGWAGQVENLTRPEKDVRDGQSATFGHNDDPGQPKLFVFSDSAPGLLGTDKEPGGEGGAKGMYLTPAVYLAATEFYVNEESGEVLTLRQAMSACGKWLAAEGFGTRHTELSDEEIDALSSMWSGQERGDNVVEVTDPFIPHRNTADDLDPRLVLTARLYARSPMEYHGMIEEGIAALRESTPDTVFDVYRKYAGDLFRYDLEKYASVTGSGVPGFAIYNNLGEVATQVLTDGGVDTEPDGRWIFYPLLDETRSEAETDVAAVLGGHRYTEIIDAERERWAPAAREAGQTDGAQDSQRETEDPIPLEAPYPEPYDMGCFGHLGEVSGAVSAHIEVATDMTLMSLLGCVSTTVGGRAIVRVREGHPEYVTHYGITQALPGRRKGGPQKWGRRPLDAWVKARVEAESLEVLKNASLRKALAKRVEDAEKAVAKHGTSDMNSMADLEQALRELKDLGEPKADCQLFTDNTTAEALALDMYPQGQRIAVISSESTFLSNLGGRYSRGEPNIDLVLKSFSQEADTGRRIGRDVPQLTRPSLTMSLSIQDDAISHLGKASVMMDERGLWGRVMWCVPRDLSGIRQYDVPNVPEGLKDEYDRRITALLDKVYIRDEMLEMRLSDEAVEEYRAFYSQTDPKLYDPMERVPFNGWHEKAAGLIVRTAALVTLYEHALDKELPTEIPARIFKAVASQLPVMIAHAHKASSFMTLNEGDPREPARKILRWISTRAQSRYIRTRDVLRAFGKDPRFPSMEAVINALDILEDHRWISYARPSENSVDKGRFWAHPVATPHLTDEAAREALETPVSAEEAEEKADARSREVQALAHILSPFVKEYCETGGDKTHRVGKEELHAAFAAYRGSEPDLQYFKQALRKVCPQVVDARVGKQRLWMYKGIRLMSQ